MKKNIIVLMGLVCLAFSSFAQEATKIQGVAIDKNTQETIPFVTITLYKDSLVVDGTVANENGNFNLKTDKVFSTIVFSFMGYESVVFKQNEIPKIKKWKVFLDQSEIELDEVDIIAKRTTTQLLVDRKVINLGADIQQSGKDMLEAMEQIPEVNIDRATGNLSLRGSGNVRVLINGKPSGLSISDLLQQIPANTVNQIELITSPSAKHRADGMTGLINIITNKKRTKGLNLNASSSVQSPSPEGLRFGINGNYNYDFFNIRLGLNHSQRAIYSTQFILREYNDNTTERIIAPNYFSGDVNGINSGIDFFIDDKNELSFSFNYTDNSHDIFRNTLFTEITDQDDYTSNYKTSHKHITTEANANYRHTFSKDHFVEFDYNININNNAFVTSINQPSFNSSENIDFNNQLHNLSIDYTLPINDNSKFESGVLYNDRGLKNDRDTTIIVDSSSENELSVFDYNEKLFAGYAMLNKQIKKFGIQLGLRYEYLKPEGNVNFQNLGGLNTYSDLFPSFHLSYKINDAHQFNGGYSKRISRPNFRHLKPFNPNNDFFVFEGNPNLTPEYGHNLELNYQFKHKKFHISTTGFLRKKTDIIESTFRLDGNTSIMSIANLGDGQSYGLEANLKVFPIKPWTIIADGNYYWGSLNTTQSVAFKTNSRVGFNIKNTVDIGKYITTDLNFRYNGKRKQFNSIYEPYSWLDWSIRATLLERRLNITFSIDDVFNNAISESKNYSPQFKNHRRYKFGKNKSRSFGLSVSYKIIQASTKKRNRKNRNYNHGGTKE